MSAIRIVSAITIALGIFGALLYLAISCLVLPCTVNGGTENLAAVSFSNNSRWKAEPINVGEGAEFKHVYFFDRSHGFALAYSGFVSAVYGTNDGGRTWAKLSTFDNLLIEQFAFVSPTEGVLIASKLKPSSTPSENGSLILKTKDGGRSWDTVYQAEKSSLASAKFSGGGRGVAVGFRQKHKMTGLVLVTRDGGSDWTDVSETLDSIYSRLDQEGRGLRQVNITDDALLVMSDGRRLFRSIDMGAEWNHVSTIDNVPAQMNIEHMGQLQDGRIWAAGGTDSIESTASVFAVINESSKGWDRNRLEGFELTDVKYIADSEVIAVGARRNSRLLAEKDTAQTGFVLYSPDLGKNWSVIYESSTPKKFTSIAVLDDSQIIVTGSNGDLLRLESKD